MALTKAEKDAAAGAEHWSATGWGLLSAAGEPLKLCPAAAVAQLRGEKFATLRGGEAVPRGCELAHEALVDVAKHLGYRDRQDEPAEIQYLEGLRLDAAALKERFLGLVAGKPRSSLPKLPRPGILEGG